ncbi:MAG: zinc ribbon domain-containing protein [Armatimonadota bacterium]|jgi:hypothetical protein
MKCDACSAEIPEDSAFCGKCGRPVAAPAREESRPAPRVPAELVREREQRAEAALQMERARLEAASDQMRGRRAIMIGVFVLALLASALVTVGVNYMRGRQQARAAAAASGPGEAAGAARQLGNITLARGRDAEGLPTGPVNVLRLGLDTQVLCFFEAMGSSGEMALSVQWWQLGTMEHEAQVTLEPDPSGEAGSPVVLARQCIPLEVPPLSAPGTWEIRFVHEGEQVGSVSVRVQQTVAD